MIKVLFMGSPDFSVSALKKLVEYDRTEVVGVVSQEDKPKGRGYEMMPTAVKAYALSVGIPVYTPHTLRDNAIADLLAEINPDVIVVVAYGKILPDYVLDYPRLGCVNIHASLLPMYRGASPINFAIIKGEKETGVTSMLMDSGLDTGDMLMKTTVPIDDNDDFGILHDKLSEAGADLLIKTLDGLSDGTIVPQKQDGDTFYAPLIGNDIKHIDFSRPSADVRNLVRGLSPVPTAFTELNGKRIKVFSCDTVRVESSALPGTLLSKDELLVKTADGAVRLTQIAPEGKRRMTDSDFMRGLRVSETSEYIFS